jgi:hypothetical protein
MSGLREVVGAAGGWVMMVAAQERTGERYELRPQPQPVFRWARRPGAAGQPGNPYKPIPFPAGTTDRHAPDPTGALPRAW